MPKNHTIRFRITKDQHEQIKYLANKNGFSYVSDFVRTVLFSKNELIESKIIETNKIVKKLLEVNNGRF
ncbi:hypothetical protein HN592_03435 [Candidatus Woesearchaeota archaeon]|jgi:hypothetical protein|nr:hypothetical protein [Candidatus Woesearchaeota archaeon]MBT4368265.1 hypothetical protein [Candidatus Woesearchaeota archaeon]MBT4712754.1 hypothetical protein [Candidatus Woesearchaeota archaeon]MBT6639666.1 hypothetical protein [Candidatus Woesearchaeota archaeon]MBT7133838.1 hypothetical protein [Candidatus Woesearchaeota archaeon]